MIKGLGDPDRAHELIAELEGLARENPALTAQLESAVRQVEQIVAHWRSHGHNDLVIGALLGEVIAASIGYNRYFPGHTVQESVGMLVFHALAHQANPVDPAVLDDILGD